MNYDKLNDQQKKDLLISEYENQKKSFQDIAIKYGTYANKIRRDATRLKITIRNKSEAQKNALKTGKANHPTQGQQRPEETKQKIGLSILKSWENIDDKELKKRKNKAKINWENKSEDEKSTILQKANEAVRETSKTGSKLEKYLFNGLLSAGYQVDFHKEQSILNTKLQIDLFVPKLNLAIEIDGPSHFAPVWGSESLKRNQKYDDKKNGLLLGKGLFLVRVQQKRDFSKSRASLILKDVLDTINKIINNQVKDNKIIYIGDE